MKAVHFHEHGDLSVLKYGTLPDPAISEGEALIRPRAVALNHLDIWVRRGWKGLNLELPHVSGSDIAGEVVDIKDSREAFRAGDRVVVYPGFNLYEDTFTRRGETTLSPGYRVIGEHVRGGLAELVKVPARSLLRLPDEVSFELAASQGLAATTCWQMLFDRARMRSGDTVLVVGAGGGVNSLVIALATLSGATVIALTSSEPKAYKARALGARFVVDYTAYPKWEREVRELTDGRGADIVVDNVGRATFAQSLRALRNGGTLVTVGNTSGHQLELDNRVIFARQLRIVGSTMGTFDDFVSALRFLWDRQVPPIIDRTAPLSGAIELMRVMEAGEQFGKLVVTVP